MGYHCIGIRGHNVTNVKSASRTWKIAVVPPTSPDRTFGCDAPSLTVRAVPHVLERTAQAPHKHVPVSTGNLLPSWDKAFIVARSRSPPALAYVSILDALTRRRCPRPNRSLAIAHGQKSPKSRSFTPISLHFVVVQRMDSPECCGYSSSILKLSTLGFELEGEIIGGDRSRTFPRSKNY